MHALICISSEQDADDGHIGIAGTSGLLCSTEMPAVHQPRCTHAVHTLYTSHAAARPVARRYCVRTAMVSTYDTNGTCLHKIKRTEAQSAIIRMLPHGDYHMKSFRIYNKNHHSDEETTTVVWFDKKIILLRQDFEPTTPRIPVTPRNARTWVLRSGKKIKKITGAFNRRRHVPAM